MLKFLCPPPAIPRMDAAMAAQQYPRFRMQVLTSTFLGYASFYLVRNNLSAVAKDVGTALLYDRSMMGDILGISAIMYGVGKLFMGALSDQSDSRKFLALGLVLTAACNFAFGSSQNYLLHLLIWALNGFVQGMGWGPCGRSLGHWFAIKERGITFAFWNISHNVGGGIAGVIAAYSAQRWGWESAFYVPGILACAGAVVMYFSVIDTPESIGLPPIDEYKDDHSSSAKMPHHNNLDFKEIMIEHVLKNRLIWIAAFANFFVYIVRYSMLDWGPTYLREVKGATLEDGGWAILLIEFAGIPSTLLVGWFSDRLGGRRGMVSLLCMIPIFFAFIGIRFNPPGYIGVDMALLVVIGFCVYPPVMMLGVMALDIAGRKAVGAAAGFIGLFGYLGRTIQAKGFGSFVQNSMGTSSLESSWNIVLFLIASCVAMAVLLLVPLWKVKPLD